MGLSRGWHRLLLFWMGVVTFVLIGAGTLQILAPPDASDVRARDGHSDRAAVQVASLTPIISTVAVSSAGAPMSDRAVEAPDDARTAQPPVAEAMAPPDDALQAPASVAVVATLPSPQDATSPSPAEASSPPEAATEPAAVVAVATSAVTDHDMFTDEPQTAAFVTASFAAGEATFDDAEGARPEASPARQVQLSIVGDSLLCPKLTCARWHVVTKRARHPHTTTIDLARLRLAPSLREAAANGEVELIINATESHKVVRGRDVISFVPTSLAGVTPHDASSRDTASLGPWGGPGP